MRRGPQHCRFYNASYCLRAILTRKWPFSLQENSSEYFNSLPGLDTTNYAGDPSFYLWTDIVSEKDWMYRPRVMTANHRNKEVAAINLASGGASSPGPMCSTDSNAPVK